MAARTLLGREALVDLLLRELGRESRQRYTLRSMSYTSNGQSQWELDAPGSSAWRRLQVPLEPGLGAELDRAWPMQPQAYRGHKPQGPRQILALLGVAKKDVDRQVRERQEAETAAMRRIRRKNARAALLNTMGGGVGFHSTSTRETLLALRELYETDASRLADVAYQALSALADHLRDLPEE